MAFIDGAGKLQHPIGQGAFPVVDVGDDRKVADSVNRSTHVYLTERAAWNCELVKLLLKEWGL
jgi:hypothetical protein